MKRNDISPVNEDRRSLLAHNYLVQHKKKKAKKKKKKASLFSLEGIVYSSC